MGYMEGDTVTITFDDARAIAATSKSVRDYWGDYRILDWGWENDQEFVLVYDLIDPEVVPFDIPALLVDKRTGKLREVYGLVGNPPAPNLTPVGHNPNP